MIEATLKGCHRIGLALLFSFCVGCTTTPLTQRLYSEPQPVLPPSAEIERTPFHPQQRYQCGPAALASVLNYRGIPVTPERIGKEVYLPQRKGSLQIELMAATRYRGLLAYQLAPSLVDLLTEVASGNPVLVLQNLSIDWFPKWHYAVVVGYDLHEETIILRSGTTKRLTMPISTFEHTWKRSQYWGVVILAPHQRPAVAKPLPYIKAAQSLEAVAQFTAAQQAYENALKYWPENKIALLGLGNTLYAQGQYQPAAATFKRMTQMRPNEPDGWNNLAYALIANGCKVAAVSAAQCASAVSGGAPQYDATLSEIHALTTSGVTTEVCEPVNCPATTPPEVPYLPQ